MVKVLVSEWARKAAHELDDWRSRWLASKEKDIYANGDLTKAKIKSDLDHERVLSDWDLLEEYIVKTKYDIELLVNYLRKLKIDLRRNNGQHRIDGWNVTPDQWNLHRQSVLEELAYKKHLSRKFSAQLKRLNITREEIFKEISLEINSDLDALNVLLGFFHKAMAQLDKVDDTSNCFSSEEQKKADAVRDYAHQRIRESINQSLKTDS